MLLALAAADPAPAQQPQTLQVSSHSFADGQRMPQRLSCDGPDVSPALQWTTIAGAKSYAIVVDDPDAPQPFTHWLAYNIPADIHALPEAAAGAGKRLARAAEGSNGFGHAGYGGPCPPPGAPHHYVFRVYALDIDPALPSGQDEQRLDAAMQGHVLAQGQLTGLYGRSN
ncbi:YbhB/YbcL family Raf kinase inhibitor-like protein [Dyella acidiphila]|uniref:YbhB/YbcL family Raf kinase inhibitor-like protein n=1 Tax=Dyella acidiphila TaxID=2775866 RepID=UPI003082D07A